MSISTRLQRLEETAPGASCPVCLDFPALIRYYEEHPDGTLYETFPDGSRQLVSGFPERAPCPACGRLPGSGAVTAIVVVLPPEGEPAGSKTLRDVVDLR